MIAQDTGSAIVGPARGDIFFGSGDAAGEIAGKVKHAADFFSPGTERTDGRGWPMSRDRGRGPQPRGPHPVGQGRGLRHAASRTFPAEDVRRFSA